MTGVRRGYALPVDSVPSAHGYVNPPRWMSKRWFKDLANLDHAVPVDEQLQQFLRCSGRILVPRREDMESRGGPGRVDVGRVRRKLFGVEDLDVSRHAVGRKVFEVVGDDGAGSADDRGGHHMLIVRVWEPIRSFKALPTGH